MLAEVVLHHSHQGGEDGVGPMPEGTAQRLTLVLTEQALGQPLHHNAVGEGHAAVALVETRR